MSQPEQAKMTLAEWRARGAELFGERARNWRFRCPRCENVATPQDFVDRGEEPERAVQIAPQECLKRAAALKRGVGTNADKPDPDRCDWAAYGLFRGPAFVIAEDGIEIPVFCFDVEPKKEK